MSIKHKLTLTIMGISIMAVMLTVLAITTYLIYDLRVSKARELGVTATLTGDRNSAALVFLDDDRARKNLDIFRLNPAILRACIYNAQGALFADYHTENYDCPPRADAIPAAQQGTLIATKDISDGTSTVGKTYIVSDTSEIDAYVQKILAISGTFTLLVLAATSMLAYYFQRTISAPILDLAETAQAITARGDYSLSAHEGNLDETGLLARAFNAMLAEVRKRDRELMKSNETLEQKVVERTRELEDAMHRAEAASAAKSEFLRNMSHEFRTPLHALISFSSYGIREHETSPPAQLRQYFELIQTGAGRLSKLVDEVLDLARLEHGEHVFSLKNADLQDVLKRASDMLEALARDKKLHLALDLPKEHVYSVCDQDKIIQVITNLLANAIKFSPQGGTITLSLSQEKREGQPVIVIAVRDEGIGIPESEKEMIFESFKQSSRTNTGAGGTGLGLAICRRIIEAHQGRIWAENNTPQPGACVTFIIPALLQEGRKVVRLHKVEA